MDRKHYLPFQVNTLKCLGMWPLNFRKILPRNLHFLNIYLNGVFYLIMSGNLLQMAFLQIKTLFDAWGTGDKDISDYIISSIIYTGGFLMCIYFQIRFPANKRMVDHLNRTLVSRSGPGLTFVDISACYTRARKLSIWWTVVCVLGTIHYGIYPILVQKRVLPINIRYPFDTQSSPTFEIMYFVQFIGQLQIGAIYSVYGIMWFSIIILICGQLDILFCTLKNVLWAALLSRGDSDSLKALKALQMKINLVETQGEYYNSCEQLSVLEERKSENQDVKIVDSLGSSAGYEDALIWEVRKAILLHQNIFRLSWMLEEFFFPFMLGKIFVCSMLACFLAYLSSSGLTSLMKVVTLVEYLCLVFAELLLITYFPTVLLYQVRNSLFS